MTEQITMKDGEEALYTIGFRLSGNNNGVSWVTKDQEVFKQTADRCMANFGRSRSTTLGDPANPEAGILQINMQEVSAMQTGIQIVMSESAVQAARDKTVAQVQAQSAVIPPQVANNKPAANVGEVKSPAVK